MDKHSAARERHTLEVGLAEYVRELCRSADLTNRAEDRRTYELHMAEAARMFSGLMHDSSLAELKEIVARERRNFGWGYLSNEEGERAESAFHRFAALVEQYRPDASSLTTADSYAVLESVTGSESFLVFARTLIADRCEADTFFDSPFADQGGWENSTIAEFLKAAVAWAEDSGFGQSQGLQGANPWRLFATFLYCGKIYE